MPALDLSKPVSFAILRSILKMRRFTQLALSKDANASLGQVNKIVSFLERRGFIERENNAFVLRKALSMLEELAKFRHMRDLLIAKFSVSISENEVKNILANDAIFCLDTALKQYCPSILSKRVCAYLNDTKVIEKLQAFEGGSTFVYLYSVDIEPKTKEAAGVKYTDEYRTAIDLVCDNAAYAAVELFERLWQERIV